MGHQLDQANEIIQTSKTHGFSHGELIVRTLLCNRSQNDLGVEELMALAKGYNWWGRHQEAFHAANTALEKQPNNEELLLAAVVYIRNAHRDTNSLLETYENYTQRRIGPAWFWRIQKAREYEFVATYDTDLEDYEWEAGDDIVHPEALEQAIDELIKAVECNRQARKRVAEHVDEQPALRQSPRFDELLAKIDTP